MEAQLVQKFSYHKSDIDNKLNYHQPDIGQIKVEFDDLMECFKIYAGKQRVIIEEIRVEKDAQAIFLYEDMNAWSNNFQAVMDEAEFAGSFAAFKSESSSPKIDTRKVNA